MKSHPLVQYWKKVKGTVPLNGSDIYIHPKDIGIFRDCTTKHSFSFEYPPPAYVAILPARATQLDRRWGHRRQDGRRPAGLREGASGAQAAQAGTNLIIQTASTQAGLVAAFFEACVIDNYMVGAVHRSLAPLEVDVSALSPEGMNAAILGEGHFLGHPDIRASMKSDFIYPDLADPRPIVEWEKNVCPDIWAASAVMQASAAGYGSGWC